MFFRKREIDRMINMPDPVVGEVYAMHKPEGESFAVVTAVSGKLITYDVLEDSKLVSIGRMRYVYGFKGVYATNNAVAFYIDIKPLLRKYLIWKNNTEKLNQLRITVERRISLLGQKCDDVDLVHEILTTFNAMRLYIDEEYSDGMDEK